MQGSITIVDLVNLSIIILGLVMRFCGCVDVLCKAESDVILSRH